jgi:hypothetical protein
MAAPLSPPPDGNDPEERRALPADATEPRARAMEDPQLLALEDSDDPRQEGYVVVRRAHKGPRVVYRVELYVSEAMTEMTHRDLGLVLANDVKKAVELLRKKQAR